MKPFAKRVVEARGFEPFMIGLILFNAVLIGTFVMLNLFIAVVINNLDASKTAELEELRDPVTHAEVLDELKRTRNALADLQRRLEALPVQQPPSRS